MRIKLKTLYANDKRIIQVGQIGNFSDDEGKALIKGKFGVCVDPVKIETATIKPEEILIKKNIVKKESKRKSNKKAKK